MHCTLSLRLSPSRLPITARLTWRVSAVFHKESTNKMDYDAIPVYVQDDEYAAYETVM